MNDHHHNKRQIKKSQDNLSFFERLTNLISSDPDSQGDLLDTMRNAYKNNLIDIDLLLMIEGVFEISELRSYDIMTHLSNIDLINISYDLNKLISFVLYNKRQYYPVYEGNTDNIIGILFTIDLLNFFSNREINIQNILHPAMFIPETKPVKILLRDFYKINNNIAIVLNEYGGVVGCISIKNILENIIKKVKDRYKINENNKNI